MSSPADPDGGRPEVPPLTLPARRAVAPSPLPPWIREKKISLSSLREIKSVMRSRSLSTVCEEARCPNRTECFSHGTATFLAMGDTCTRTCGFCEIAKGRPAPLDPAEPEKIADAAAEMGLSHVVVTSVDRDDLPDGGASHFVRIVDALRRRLPGATVELLTPDFRGDGEAIDRVADSRPDLFNHNVETVPRLYRRVRFGSDFERSVGLLARVRRRQPGLVTKSGLMVGLGETPDEVLDVLRALRAAGVGVVTIGQYLRPSRERLPVEEYVSPDRFRWYEEQGMALGFAHVFSGPFVRSSYRAEEGLRAAAPR